MGLDMNDTNQILVYLDVINLIDDDIRTIERNGDILLILVRMLIGLAVNTGKTKYVGIGSHPDMIANVHIGIGSKSYEKVKTLNI